MGRFAKIIELPDDEQVLVTKGWDVEEDAATLTFTTEIDGMNVAATATFNSETTRDNAFDNYSVETAKGWVDYMTEMLTAND